MVDKKEMMAKKGAPTGEAAAGATNCAVKTCKKKDERFGFCSEHYDHFKFGLVKKNGEQVSDYEKKIEHYMAYKQRQQGARKAA